MKFLGHLCSDNIKLLKRKVKCALTRRKWEKWILCIFISGKLRFDNTQRQILPSCIYATGFCTQKQQANSIPYAIFVKRKFPEEQTTLKNFAEVKIIFSSDSSGINLLLFRHDVAWKATEPWLLHPANLFLRYAETQSQSSFWLSLLISLLFSAEPT